MTLEELNTHYDLLEKCDAAKSMLRSFRDTELRATSMDGMPHGSGVSDKVGTLAVEICEMERRILHLESGIEKSERAVLDFLSNIQDDRTRLVFRLRFIRGLQWREVAAVLGGGNTIEGVKSLCYRYLFQQDAPP